MALGTSSNITDIYKKSGELDTTNKYFELKVYQVEVHGFMIKKWRLFENFTAKNAYDGMISFFDRTLKNPIL